MAQAKTKTDKQQAQHIHSKWSNVSSPVSLSDAVGAALHVGNREKQVLCYLSAPRVHPSGGPW